ncbi:glycosyltransferase [Amaricoccus sp.]|uniref:glycosyltransferase n=1 Tax=Amaricoccus sp. TaxID=1872485 RepID=UPI001B7392E0|nr:glycosyltransferase [Amaricoccus sp.]MBP7002894.1 glycosyltransferase [Amaricoccus sp.]
MRPPRILFVHDAFPGQFGALGRWLAAEGWDVAFATAAPSARADGFRLLRYAPHRKPQPGTHPCAQPMDRAAINAQAFVRAALAARRDGYRPDIVVAHSGWGAGMFARDVFPEAAFVAYCEWWYRHPGVDVAYLAALEGRPASGAEAACHAAPEGRAPAAGVEAAMHERARNAPIAMDLAASDAAICPTAFQAAQFPDVFRRHLGVLHDGVDADAFAPAPAAEPDTLDGLVAPDARLVTYATRGMEPHRGFPQFMAALPAILAADPRAVAVIAGDNRVSYGGDAIRRVDWKARALAEHDLDPTRVRFTGKLPRADYLRLLRRSDAHVYLTVPFVLSWSMVEAMSTGCALVLSDTAPVREFADAEAAALVDLARPAAIAGGVLATLADPAAAARRRGRARETVLAGLTERQQFPAKRALLAGLRG